MVGFHRGLAETGFAEGRNVTIEYRWAEGQFDRLPGMAADLVRAGFVLSLGRPGGNVTGATFMGVELVAKRLELLHEILSGITRIALLVNPNNPGLMQDNIELSKVAMQRLGLELVVVEAGSENEIERAVVEA